MKKSQIYKHYSIQDLVDFPECAIFALVSEELNMIYISEASKLIIGVNKLIGDFKRSPVIRPLLPKFELWVLECETHQLNRQLRVGFIMDEFKAEGWKVLNKKKPLRFKGSMIAKKGGLYYVYLNSARSSKYVVGVFESAEKAKNFYSLHYRNKVIRKMIYCDNKLTREYLGHKFPK